MEQKQFSSELENLILSVEFYDRTCAVWGGPCELQSLGMAKAERVFQLAQVSMKRVFVEKHSPVELKAHLFLVHLPFRT